MIFFRSKTVQLKYQRGSEKFLLFGKLKVFYKAPVNKLSGMTVNLKDVDLWLKQADVEVASLFSTKKSFSQLRFEFLRETLKIYYSALKGSSEFLQKVELSMGSIRIEYDGNDFYQTYRMRTWFKQDSTWVQQSISLKTPSLLTKKWRGIMMNKKWSSGEVFSKLLKQHLPGLQVLEIQNPSWQGIEKYSF